VWSFEEAVHKEMPRWFIWERIFLYKMVLWKQCSLRTYSMSFQHEVLFLYTTLLKQYFGKCSTSWTNAGCCSLVQYFFKKDVFWRNKQYSIQSFCFCFQKVVFSKARAVFLSQRNCY
jgi:hypothetical protein